MKEKRGRTGRISLTGGTSKDDDTDSLSFVPDVPSLPAVHTVLSYLFACKIPLNSAVNPAITRSTLALRSMERIASSIAVEAR